MNLQFLRTLALALLLGCGVLRCNAADPTSTLKIDLAQFGYRPPASTAEEPRIKFLQQYVLVESAAAGTTLMFEVTSGKQVPVDIVRRDDDDQPESFPFPGWIWLKNQPPGSIHAIARWRNAAIVMLGSSSALYRLDEGQQPVLLFPERKDPLLGEPCRPFAQFITLDRVLVGCHAPKWLVPESILLSCANMISDAAVMDKAGKASYKVVNFLDIASNGPRTRLATYDLSGTFWKNLGDSLANLRSYSESANTLRPRITVYSAEDGKKLLDLRPDASQYGCPGRIALSDDGLKLAFIHDTELQIIQLPNSGK